MPIWCQICQKKHWDPKIDPNISRLKVVLGSSTLAHLWKTEGYQNGFHIGKTLIEKYMINFVLFVTNFFS